MRRKVKESQLFKLKWSRTREQLQQIQRGMKKCDVLFKVEDEYSLYWSLVVSKQIIS